jgi:hypothetical protein
MTGLLLFTSSRDGVTETDIKAALRPLFAPGKILVCGGARGGDQIAARLWRRWGGPVDEHPVTAAEWQHSRGAGYARNAAMVAAVTAAGEGECLAVIARCTRAGCPRPGPHGTHGAVHCAGLAQAAGLPVHRVTASPRPPGQARTATLAAAEQRPLLAAAADTPAGLNPPPCARMTLPPGTEPDDRGLAAWRRWNATLEPGPCGWPNCPEHGLRTGQAEAGS